MADDDDKPDEPQSFGKKGKAKRFSARITKPRGEDPVETTAYSVSLKAPRKPPSYLQPAPYHQEGDDPFPPGQATTFLQIWELDTFAGAGKYLDKAEGDYGESKNQLLASIPGCVILKDKTFHFRSMGQAVPTRSFDDKKGRLLLKLTNTDEEEVEVKVNLPEYEGILEVAACLAPTAATGTLSSVKNASGVTFVHNVHAAAHKQLRDRSGIAVACIPDYPASCGARDAEFQGQAEQLLGTLPTFKVDGGKLRLGYNRINGYQDIADKLAEVRKKAKEELKLASEPKVTTLILFGHGIRRGLRLDPNGWTSGTLRAKHAAELVNKIKPHVGAPLVLTLFACNNGRGERAWTAKSQRMQGHNDPSYGLALAGEIPGYDSLGWHMHAELEKAGIKNTVWGHTTTGHTTRNCRLRVFSSWGVADFASCLYGGRALEKKTLHQYGRQTNYSFKNQKREIAQQKLSNANLVRAISTHSALYLDWSWVPGSAANDKDPLWRAQAASECQEAVKKFKDLMTIFDVAPEEWTYEDAATKAHITGKSADGGNDPHFSKNFSWKELKAKSSSFRLSVKLIQAAQALLTPSSGSASVSALIENGDGLVLKARRTKYRDVFKKQAALLQGQGLLKTALPVGKRELLINVSGVQYDAACKYVIGGPAEAYLTRSIKLGDFGAKPPAKISRALLEIAQELLDAVPNAKLVGVDPGGEMLYLESDSPELERLAEELEAGGILEDAQKLADSNRVRIATAIPVVSAP